MSKNLFLIKEEKKVEDAVLEDSCVYLLSDLDHHNISH